MGHTAEVRLFVAVDLPDPVIDIVETLERPSLAQLRWTTPEQWHVTLRFLGEVASNQLDALTTALDAVAGAVGHGGGGVEAQLGPTVAWFKGRRILQVPVAGLETLAAQVARATEGWGEAPDHQYRGHLTLARVRGSKPGPASLAGVPLHAEWFVSEVVLSASTLGRGGSVYEALHRVPLAV